MTCGLFRLFVQRLGDHSYRRFGTGATVKASVLAELRETLFSADYDVISIDEGQFVRYLFPIRLYFLSLKLFEVLIPPVSRPLLDRGAARRARQGRLRRRAQRRLPQEGALKGFSRLQ